MAIHFQVFIAELMRGAGKAWHKGCFTCNLCNKRVDSSNLCEREGDIYCKGGSIVSRKVIMENSLKHVCGLFFFSLLRQEFRTKRIRFWHWSWMLANDLNFRMIEILKNILLQTFLLLMHLLQLISVMMMIFSGSSSKLACLWCVHIS